MLRRILRRMAGGSEPKVEPVRFDQMAGRRATARAYMRSRGIKRVKGLYGAPPA